MSVLTRFNQPKIKRLLVSGHVPENIHCHARRNYIMSAILSFPPWVSRAELKKIEDEARRLTRTTGVPHEVNHVIPLRHPLVSGLTVPCNLEIITRAANGRIGNCFELRHCEQIPLFELQQHEQYQLSLGE